MTVHLISVGLSVLRALEDPEKLKSDPGFRDKVAGARAHELLAAEGIDDLDSGRVLASQWIADALAGGDAGPASRLRGVADDIRPHDWPQNMSAELDTFAKVQHSLKSGRGFTLGRDDIVVLICSDTRDGLLAGAWNAIAIAGGTLSRVSYVPDLSVPFGKEVGASLRGRVTMVRVAGMDAGAEGFRAAMKGLGLLARRLFQSGSLKPGEGFQFILSGGFKAVIPYLIGLAETVRSVDDACLADIGVPELTPAPVPYPVTAWVQHETTMGSGPPIQLPLRRLLAEVARQEVSGYDEESGERDDPLGTTFLEGYAFDIKKKKFGGRRYYKLTPFGEGLAAFLGVSHERPGG